MGIILETVPIVCTKYNPQVVELNKTLYLRINVRISARLEHVKVQLHALWSF